MSMDRNSCCGQGEEDFLDGESQDPLFCFRFKRSVDLFKPNRCFANLHCVLYSDWLHSLSASSWPYTEGFGNLRLKLLKLIHRGSQPEDNCYLKIGSKYLSFFFYPGFLLPQQPIVAGHFHSSIKKLFDQGF